jgi:hypothetical protein
MECEAMLTLIEVTRHGRRFGQRPAMSFRNGTKRGEQLRYTTAARQTSNTGIPFHNIFRNNYA